MENIYYLNMQELRDFCDAHGIPYTIYFEAEDGSVRKSRDVDRKGLVIDRVVHFITTGAIKPRTVFVKSVVRLEAMRSSLAESDRIFYGQYKDSDPNLLKLMEQLTGGQFEAG